LGLCIRANPSLRRLRRRSTTSDCPRPFRRGPAPVAAGTLRLLQRPKVPSWRQLRLARRDRSCLHSRKPLTAPAPTTLNDERLSSSVPPRRALRRYPPVGRDLLRARVDTMTLDRFSRPLCDGNPFCEDIHRDRQGEVMVTRHIEPPSVNRYAPRHGKT
jgi:hypothetical protein